MDKFKGQPRLPKFAVPKRYDLRLIPDLIACTFTGTVSIDVDIVADTRFIVLNAADISVNDDSVSFTPLTSSKALAAPKVALFEEDEILVLEFAEILPHGVGVLQLGFSGILNDKLKGFYKSTYEHNGEKKNMAVTQFEPADARKCFPCWDEPACKATFKITLEVPTELVALSNMPIVDEKVDGNVKVVSYQESPIMSTYLVAIVVGLFDYVEDHTSDGIKVRVYCQVGKADQGKFALHVGAKTLDLFKEYFAVPYPLPKMDMIAIPDFAAGAMENYGLVTYRETVLLYDEQHSAASNKQRVAIVVAHELAHQWFGNLVTMEWWTHLWLNEGFATWVSYLAIDSLFPEWKIWTQFLDESTDGLRLDGLEESHPIEVEVNHVAEIDEIFDAISYMKGASVIRMLQSYLGAEVFQDILLVSAKIKDGKLELEQSRFLSSGSPGEGQWIVPVTVCCGSYDMRKNFLLESKSGVYDLKELFGCSIADGAWIKINVDQAGFYRVKYDDTLAAGLRNATENQSLTSIDRYGILDDSFALSMARQQSLASLLTLISAYKKELDYTVLSNLIVISYKVVKISADANLELMSEIKQLFIGVFQFAAGKLSWEPKQGESHLDAMLRGEVLTALAVFGHDETLTEATRRFDAFLADRNTSLLPPDLRRAAYVAVMQRANKSDKSGYESLLRVYRETEMSEEKTRILGSLACCPDPSIVQDVLTFVLSDEVRNQDALYGLYDVSWEGREVAWKWLQEKWEYIEETWGSGFLITRFISALVSPFASFEKAKEVEEFFATRSKPSMARTLKQSIERVHINANWVESIRKEDNLTQLVAHLSSN
ncbi:unnamed protein product [Brassica napus]|uniref:Aminopeptidase n=1 Tax=Brassica napus TaxID=3708 RepID=A0A816ZYT4_BRANA|nr:unnamed protein product [Brassica napus]